ncbi:MAG: branched-chain amino acid ABC transporter permease [Rhodospirillales bacterium]
MDVDSAFWVSQVLNGLVTGTLLMLITFGLTIIFGILLVVNFAHGSLYALGAYLAATITAVTQHFWLALVLVPIVVAVVGVLIERFAIRPMRQRTVIMTLLLTFGLALIIDEVTRLIWGAAPRAVPVPELLSGAATIFGFTYPLYRLFIVALGAALALLLYLFLEKTDLGTVIRAASSDAEIVQVMGINTSLLFTCVFALGCGLAGLSGVIAAPLQTVGPSMGTDIIVDAFVVLVLGGLGSLRGTVMAALLVGQVRMLGAAVISEYSSVLTFVLMAGVLLVRPRGLLNLGRLDDGH